MSIWFYIFGALIGCSVIAVNVWFYTRPRDEQKHLNAAIQDPWERL